MPARRPVDQEILDYYVKEKRRGKRKDTLAEIQRLWPDRFGGLGYGAIEKAIRSEFERRGTDCNVVVEQAIIDAIPIANDLPEQMKDFELEYEDCLVLSDCHIPQHDPIMLGRALQEAKQRKLRRCILNGDTFDNEWASTYIKFGATVAVEEQLHKVGEFVLAILKAGITEIIFINGNHEDRIERLTGGSLSIMGLVAMMLNTLTPAQHRKARSAIKVTTNYWVRLVNTPDGVDWELHHQWNYRQKRLSTANDLALKVTNCHTGTGHEHHAGWTITENGKWFAVNFPCLEDDRITGYKQRRKRVIPNWIRGYTLLLGGVPHIRTHIHPPDFWDGIIK